MANPKIEPENLLPLTPAVFHVLLALAGGERHGYAIMQEVAEHTDGQIKMGPGTLYGTVKRLLAVQLIEEPSACPGSRSFRVVLAWGSTTPAQAAAARTPGRFVLPLPDFTFATRDEHDHGSRALYAFDARVIGEVAAAP